MKDFFAILGGMGTKATESFIKTLNTLTPAKKDQDYLNYIVFNHAEIPDRTNYILDHSQADPWPYLKEDILQINQLGAKFVLITCNTAHYFLPELKKLATMPILDMPKLATTQAITTRPNQKNLRIGILATSGTIQTGIYQKCIHELGQTAVIPDQDWQNKIMTLIYAEIKQEDKVNPAHYHELITYMLKDLNCDAVILGCTELSVAQERAPYQSAKVIDAQRVLAEKTILMAK